MLALSIVPMIRMVAASYGVHPGLAVIIARRESDFNPNAISDNGLAVGLWQWDLKSWKHVRQSMGMSTFDLRTYPWDSTVTAMYAMGVLHLYSWWSTYQPALTELGGSPDE